MAGLTVVFSVFAVTPEAAAVEAQAAAPAAVSNIGRAMLSLYLVPFQVTGLILLLVMIGASYLARKTGADRQTDGSAQDQGAKP